MAYLAKVLAVFCALLVSASAASAHTGRRVSRLRRAGATKGAQFDNDVSQTMKSQYPWYHSSDEIHAEATRLAGACNGAMSMRTVEQNGVSIDVASVRAKGTSPSNKFFLLFGEHARELISPESGLYFLKTLCGETSSSERAQEVLKDTEFEVVLNGNPRSRAKVEQGDYCLRVNPNGVDLNRNWDEKWEGGSGDMAMTNPGPAPFSEPETQIFKQVVTEFNPTVFLTIHSGTRGMYMPWAFDMEHLADRNQGAMMQILKDIDAEHCECPFGAAGREVGYSCPGTCLDYVYDQLKADYAFAFEIYTSEDKDADLKARWQAKMQQGGEALLQQGASLAHSHFHDVFATHSSSDFVQTAMSSEREAALQMPGFDCFPNFNPDSQDTFNSVVSNWADAYLDMAQMVVKDRQAKTSQPSQAAQPPAAGAGAGSAAGDLNATVASLMAWH